MEEWAMVWDQPMAFEVLKIQPQVALKVVKKLREHHPKILIQDFIYRIQKVQGWNIKTLRFIK